MTTFTSKPKVFVSYSRRDAHWMDLLQSRLDLLTMQGVADIFVDKKLPTGEIWLRGIKKALNEMDIAILMISSHFLNSDFISRVELPRIRLAARNRRVLVIPIFLDGSAISRHSWLFSFQSTTRNNPLSEVDIARQTEIIDDVVERIKTFALSHNTIKRFLTRNILNWRFFLPFTFLCALVVIVSIFGSWRQIQRIEVRSIASGFPLSTCQADPSGSALQLFERGWLVARFITDEFMAISKIGADRIKWQKIDASGFTKGSTISCPGVTAESLLRLGFRWWYCADDSKALREEIGEPLSTETRAWLQYQRWTDGLFIYGLPSTGPGIDQGLFQILSGTMLENFDRPTGNGSMFGHTGGTSIDSEYCTALWYPADKNNGRHANHDRFLGNQACKTIRDPDYYLEPRARCSISGYE